jgi:hypothetical protein
MPQGTLVLSCAYALTFQGDYRFVYINDIQFVQNLLKLLFQYYENTWAVFCSVDHFPASSGRSSSLEGSSAVLPVWKHGSL